MSSIVSLLYNDWIKPRKRTLLIIAMIVVFGVASVYAYKWFAQPIIAHKNIQNMSNMNERNQTVEIYFFAADWCPHCTKAKPEWGTFKKSYDGKEVNGYVVKCIFVDCTETSQHNDLIQKFNVDSYPTLKLVKDGNQIDFDSKINSESLGQFVDTILQ